MPQTAKNRGWTVTFAGTGINLAFGILYTWSIFKGDIRKSIESEVHKEREEPEKRRRLDPRGLAIEATIAGWLPDTAVGSFPEALTPRETSKAAKTERDRKPSEMIKSADFYILWIIYFIGAGAGLMVIGSVAGMAKRSMGEMAFLVVAIMAIGNAGGVGGFVLSRFSQMLKGSIGSLTPSFVIAALLLIIGTFLTFRLESRLSKQGVT